MKRIALLVFLTLLAFASAVAAGQEAGAAPPTADQARLATPQNDAYRLFSGDVVEIRFFFNPELNDQVQIRPDGRISLQLIGEVVMAGKTIREISTELEKAYAHELKNPRVNVQIRGYAGQKIYVTGEVIRPGMISMPGELTVGEAIGEAGGIKVTGNTKTVVVIRKGPDNRPQKRTIKLVAGGNPTADAGMKLLPFDIVMVPESKITQLNRWIDQHIKQMSPANLVAGFTYVMQNPTTSSNFVPF